MLRSGLIAKECRSAPLSFKTDRDHPNTRCALYQYIVIHGWLHSTNEGTESIGADAGPAPFRFTNGAGPTPASFLRFGVVSYFQDSIMTIEGQNGVDHVDRKAQWPHFLDKETRFCFVAQRVTNMRLVRRCWDCPDGRVPQNTPFNSCGGGAGRGGNMQIERGGSTYLYTSAAGALSAEKAWFAAGMVQAGLLLHFLARSRRIRISRYTLAPEPLEDIDHRPLHNL